MSPQEMVQTVQNKVSLRVFLLGLLWAMLAACFPVATLIIDWVTRWSDPPDMTMIWHQVAVLAIGGAVAFWRKNKALLALPPDFQAAKDLQAAAIAAADKQAGK